MLGSWAMDREEVKVLRSVGSELDMNQDESRLTLGPAEYSAPEEEECLWLGASGRVVEIQANNPPDLAWKSLLLGWAGGLVSQENET